MSGEQRSGSGGLLLLTVLLALICAAGGYLLYTGWTPPAVQTESAAEFTMPAPETRFIFIFRRIAEVRCERLLGASDDARMSGRY